MSGHVWSASNNSPVSRIAVAGALVCLCVLLFSCPNPSSIGEIAADLGLSIVATIPPNGDSSFSPGQPIVVTFNRNLDPACIAGVAPVVIPGDPSVTLTFSVDGPKLIIEPHPYLQSDHTYIVSLEPTLKDSSGATLPQQVDLTFTTGDAPAGDFTIHGGGYVNTRNVTLDVQHNPAATRMRVAESATALASMSFGTAASGGWELSDGDGSKTLYVQFANDDGSMTSPVRSAGTVLDTQQPTIESASIAPYYNLSNDGSNPLRASIVASDDGSGVDSYTWSIDGVPGDASPYSVLSPRLVIGGQEGPHSVSVTVKDRAGNSSVPYLLTTIRDTVPPATPSPGVEVSPPAVLDGSNIFWSWTASSLPNPYQTPDTLQATLNGSPVVGETQYGPISVGDGAYNLAVAQRDAAGNESQPLLMPVVVSPVIPWDGSTGVSQTPYLQWRELGPEGGKSRYRVHLWPSDALSDPEPRFVPGNLQMIGPYDLNPGKTYYWYIEYSPNGDGNWPVRSPAGDGTHRFTVMP